MEIKGSRFKRFFKEASWHRWVGFVLMLPLIWLCIGIPFFIPLLLLTILLIVAGNKNRNLKLLTISALLMILGIVLPIALFFVGADCQGKTALGICAVIMLSMVVIFIACPLVAAVLLIVALIKNK